MSTAWILVLLILLQCAFGTPLFASYKSKNETSETNAFGIPRSVLPPSDGLISDPGDPFNWIYNNTVYLGEDSASGFDPLTGETVTSEPNIAGDHVVTTTVGEGNTTQETQFTHIPSASLTDPDGNVVTSFGQPSNTGAVDSATSVHSDGTVITSTGDGWDGGHDVTVTPPN